MSSMFADARTKSSKYSGPYCDESWMPRGGDDHGHGTHCAGVVGGTSLGRCAGYKLGGREDLGSIWRRVNE
ncbi:hypothetical protein PG990_004111 [Apiospora arundinis]